MKLLQINSNVNSGGAGRIVEQIGVQAINNGWQSYIAFGRLWNESASSTIKIGNKKDVLFHGVKSLIYDRHGFGSRKATKKLIHEINIIKPDVIHLHGLHGYYLNVELFFTFLKKYNRPVVWTMHDCWAITGHCTFFSDINCSKWVNGCYNCPKFRNYPRSIFFDNSKRNYSDKMRLFTTLENVSIVSVSKWLTDIMKNSFLSLYPQINIMNGVDVSRFCPIDESTNNIRAKYGINNKKMLLGVATSWGVRKGWNDYIALSKIINNDIIIVLVGLSKKQIKFLPKNIIGIERTESIKELAEFYSTADIIMNLSYQESFGLTTVEGMACGTPGIVYNATASPELISPDTGGLVETGNIPQLLKTVELILNRGKAFYTNNCRSRAIELFNHEDRTMDYIRLYNSIK